MTLKTKGARNRFFRGTKSFFLQTNRREILEKRHKEEFLLLGLLEKYGRPERMIGSRFISKKNLFDYTKQVLNLRDKTFLQPGNGHLKNQKEWFYFSFM